MPDITLRAYSKEIDDLIEHDQLDEAISHCRHILQTYPKHLDTYRALGKSYLEAKRYGDAADIFQRVLSAIPDDFVSHIGMSIVREDEGNLDASIWHMERAFETNPANPAIQQELRRLIGRRDGLEPHKVRLTRGALARMYAQGELYPQAIAELRSALAEDSDRPDLDVLLAKMFWNTEQFAEAVDICHTVLDKLPFCLEANKITAAVLQMTGKTDDARAYHRRLVALDPYTAFLENAKSDPHTVDAASVRLAKLDWVPGQPMPSAEPRQSDWAAALGVESTPDSPPAPSIEDDGEVPSWMADLEQQQEIPGPLKPVEETPEPVRPPVSISPDSQPFSSAVPDDDGSIPEWMRDAGWTESDQEIPETPISFSDEELSKLETGEIHAASSDTGELAPAEIPGWLQDIAPEDTPPAPPVPAPPARGEKQDVQPEVKPSDEGPVPGWLSDIAADAAEVTPEPGVPARAPEDAATEVADVPSWLDAPSPGATPTIVTWLGDKPGADTEAEIAADESETPAASTEDEELPSWMSADEDEEAEGVDETPSWLSGVAEAAAQPEIAHQIISTPETSAEPDEVLMPSEEPDAPDWLQAIASSEEPDMTSDEESDEAPDWLSDLRSVDEPVDEIEGEVSEPEFGFEEEDIPEAVESASWLNRISSAQEPETVPEAVEEIDEGEDWLARLEQPEEEPETETAPEWLRTSDTPGSSPLGRDQEPDWLSGIGEAEPEETSSAAEAESLDWLDGLSESATEPDQEQSLDWLDGIDEESPLPASVSEEAAEESLPDAMEVPDWLQESEVTVQPAKPSTDAEAEWLQEFEAAGDDDELEPTAEIATLEPESRSPAESLDLSDADDGEVMQWLETLAEQQSQAEATEPRPSAIPGPAPADVPPVSDRAIPDTAEESLDWLEELADTRGLDDSIPIESTAEAAVDDGAVDWLGDLAEPTSAQADTIQPPLEEPIEQEAEISPAGFAETIPIPPMQMEPQPAEEVLPEEQPVIAPAPGFSDKAFSALEEREEEGLHPARAEEAPAQPAPASISLEEPPVEEGQDIPAAPVQGPAAATPAPDVPPVERIEQNPFEAANAMLESGDVDAAAKQLGVLIKRGKSLDDIISMLTASLAAEQRQPELWQVLGDAYMKNNQVNEAVQAYQRGMEVA
ncbi:MAG: tetratricopeptide repeat protein [Anaerolineales bacterium]|nr:tetratricopeptide repeat protein [Anaerolineales bacterium]